MATSAPGHLYFGWHVVQNTDSEIATKKKVKGKVDLNKDAAGSSNSVIDLTNERDRPDKGSTTGGKKRRMDRWDERPSNTDSGNGVSDEVNQNLSGARSCQLAHCCWGYPPQGRGQDCDWRGSFGCFKWLQAAVVGIAICWLSCSQVIQVLGAQVSGSPRPRSLIMV